MPPPVTSPSPHPRRRRLAAGSLALLLLGGAGAGAWIVATRTADAIEARSSAAVRAAFGGAALDWARVEASGLQVIVAGTAPDEAARARALAEAGGAVGPGRLVDRITIADTPVPAAPAMAVEVLRNDAAVTLMGMVPDRGARDRLAGALAQLGGQQSSISDLIEVADAPAPAGWDAAVALGLQAAQALPRARVSIAPGRVAVTALADSPAEKDRVEAALRQAAPEGVTLDLAVTAPLPTVSPYTLRFVRNEAGGRLEACTAPTDAERARILAAGRDAGLTGAGDCIVALGAPSPAWTDAASAAVAAVGQLGQGQVTITDAAVVLDAPATTPRADFDAAVARLQGALPPPFRLTATLQAPSPGATAPAVTPPEFAAFRAADGLVTLRGRVSDDRMRNTVDSLARARFGQVQSDLRNDPSVPDGWTLRVIAAMEAMADLDTGSAVVTPDSIAISGASGDANAAATAVQALSQRLGAGAAYSTAIRYDRRLDPALALPDGAECADRANAVMATAEIGFEPGGAEIAGDVAPTIEALKGALADCDAFRLEVGGHTDAQGSEAGNQTLSNRRAQAVLAAMTAAGIDAANLTAIGYGESRPLASNETDAGREANRRIEFRLVAPEPVGPPAAPVTPVEGVTTAAAIEPVPPHMVPPAAEVPAELAPQAADATLAVPPDPGLATSPPPGYTDPTAAGGGTDAPAD